MEPGHEDREDSQRPRPRRSYLFQPQWGPVTETGKTSTVPGLEYHGQEAAMQPRVT
jgi:hypothetical protein